MTSALDIIQSALGLTNAVGVDQTLTAQETSDCLARFNRMIDAWNADNLMVYNTFYATFPSVVGQASYTIGPAGNWVSNRPQSIENPGICTYQGVDFPIWSMTQSEYNTISLKTQQSQIVQRFLYINNDAANGIVVLWPTPAAVVNLSFNFNTIMTGPATAASTVAFPPGYEECFEQNLALRLAPLFGKTPSPDLQRMAKESMATVKKANRTSPMARYDSALVDRNVAIYQRGY